MAGTSDRELMTRIQDGNRNALNELVREYYPTTLSAVRRAIPSPEDAEDVTQDIFLHLLTSIQGFRGNSTFHTWFTRLVRNRIATYWRVSLRHDDRLDIIGRELKMHPFYEEGEDFPTISSLLSSVPRKYRGILLMHLEENMSFVEIARRLGRSYESTYSHYRYAIVHARKEIRAEDLHP